jgi:hypothetical protein
MLADAGRAVVSWVLLAHTASATWALAPWFIADCKFLVSHGFVLASVENIWSSTDRWEGRVWGVPDVSAESTYTVGYCFGKGPSPDLGLGCCRANKLVVFVAAVTYVSSYVFE